MDRLELGEIVLTTSAACHLAAAGIRPSAILERHATGDWGDVGEDCKAGNALSISDRGRVFSMYLIGEDFVCVSTLPDRSSTTVYLEGED